MKKGIIILIAVVLIVSSCGQATKNQAVAIEQDNEIVINDNNQSKIIDSFVYYKERIIIDWFHNDEDLEEYMSKYTDEEWEIVVDDYTYYSGTASIYFKEKGEKFVVTTADSIGFIYQQDTVVITKKGIYKYTKENQGHGLGQEDGKGFWDKIILFDGKRKPVITDAIDVHYDNDEYSWFFKNKNPKE